MNPSDAKQSDSWERFVASVREQYYRAELPTPEVMTMQYAATDFFLQPPQGLTTETARSRAFAWLGKEESPTQQKSMGPSSTIEDEVARRDRETYEYVKRQVLEERRSAPGSDGRQGLDDALRQYRKDIQQHQSPPTQSAARHTSAEDPVDSRAYAGDSITVRGARMSPRPDAEEDPLVASLIRRSLEDHPGRSLADVMESTSPRRHREQQRVGTSAIGGVSTIGPVEPFMGLKVKLDNRASFEHPLDHSETERRRLAEKQISRLLAAISGARDSAPDWLDTEENERYHELVDGLHGRALDCERCMETLNADEDDISAAEAGLSLEVLVLRKLLRSLSSAFEQATLGDDAAVDGEDEDQLLAMENIIAGAWSEDAKIDA